VSKLYVVQRRTWFDDHLAFEGTDCIEGSGVAVAAFITEAAATAHARQLEQLVRADASSPFLFVIWDNYEHHLEVTEEGMCATVRSLGLDPPEEVQERYFRYRPWPRWYDGIAATLTPGQFAGLWELFEKLKVYEVVEVELDEKDP
jgi:hypothetical protein